MSATLGRLFGIRLLPRWMRRGLATAALVARFGFDPRSAAMVEDVARNLEPAAAIGMTTVWLDAETEWSREGADQDHVHHRIDDLATWLKAIIDG